jgi:hypothetical protein
LVQVVQVVSTLTEVLVALRLFNDLVQLYSRWLVEAVVPSVKLVEVVVH